MIKISEAWKKITIIEKEEGKIVTEECGKRYNIYVEEGEEICK